MVGLHLAVPPPFDFVTSLRVVSSERDSAEKESTQQQDERSASKLGFPGRQHDMAEEWAPAPSRSEIESRPHTKEQLGLWGVPWPPPSGWKSRLIDLHAQGAEVMVVRYEAKPTQPRKEKSAGQLRKEALAKARADVLPAPSPEQIEQGKSPKGGFTRERLREWGVPWPPPKGWRSDLDARWRRENGLPPRPRRSSSCPASGTATPPRAPTSTLNTPPSSPSPPVVPDPSQPEPLADARLVEEVRDANGRLVSIRWERNIPGRRYAKPPWEE